MVQMGDFERRAKRRSQIAVELMDGLVPCLASSGNRMPLRLLRDAWSSFAFRALPSGEAQNALEMRTSAENSAGAKRPVALLRSIFDMPKG